MTMGIPAVATSLAVLPTLECAAANDTNVSTWLENPDVRALLNSCAANSPRSATRIATYTFTRDEWVQFSGRRVERLRTIERRYCEAAMVASYHGDRSLWEAHKATRPAGVSHARFPKLVDAVVYDAAFGRGSIL